MADTKQTKTIGEHHVCSVLARYGWAPALTRDGLERTDILAVQTTGERRTIEVQVKSIRASASWPLGLKSQSLAVNDREWFVMVQIDSGPLGPIRSFIVPRNHLAAAIWIAHRHWLSEPGIPPGTRNTGIHNARLHVPVVAGYKDRWDLLLESAYQAPVLLPPQYRKYALETRVGLPPDHPWHDALPDW